MSTGGESMFHIGWVEVGLTLALLIFYIYYTWTSAYSYWKRKRVPCLKPSFPFGNFADMCLVRKCLQDFYIRLYNDIGDRPFCGIFAGKTPILVFKDPELIKHILTKDFNYFIDHGWQNTPEHEPLIFNLFFMKGEAWKSLRSKMSPAFSSGKMKMMFPIMNGCANQLKLSLDNASKGPGTIEAKDVASRFTLDIIINSVFGVNSNSINNPDCEFYVVGKKMFEKSLKIMISTVTLALSPKLYNLLKLHLVGYEACLYFADLIRDTIAYREKTQTVRNDFVDLLVRLKNNLSIEDADMFSTPNSDKYATNADMDNGKRAPASTMNDVIAEALVFFFGGFQTTANAIAFALYELSKLADIQQKLQEELDTALKQHGGEFTYQMMQELPYLDNIISETHRRYAAVSNIDRVCVKPYQIPNTDIVLDRGCKVTVIAAGLHHDPQYYPDPFRFDPDRFLEENVKARPTYTFMPFGDGPRICIGWRFARMEMRLGLAAFFSQFSCKLNPRTREPLQLARSEIVTNTNNDILIDVTRRKNM